VLGGYGLQEETAEEGFYRGTAIGKEKSAEREQKTLGQNGGVRRKRRGSG